MEPVTIARWTVAGIIFVGGGAIVAVNWAIVYRWVRYREHHSLAGFVGSAAMAAALVLAFGRRGATWAWLPLLVDPGGFYLLVGLVVGLRRSFRAGQRSREARRRRQDGRSS